MAARSLRLLARLHGVQTSYLDMARRRQSAHPETLLAVLRALGVSLDGGWRDVPAAWRHSQLAHERQGLEPVAVAWAGTRAQLELRLPAGPAERVIRWSVQFEHDETLRADIPVRRLTRTRTVRVAGETFHHCRLPLPPRLPVGYHQLTLEYDDRRHQSLLLVAPPQCHTAPTARKSWGLFAPLYALHSAGSWGGGDFGDLAAGMTWLASLGGSFMATLPLLPAFLDQPCEPSPYSPVSRLFWNEFFLDLEQVPELHTCAAARKLLESAPFQKSLQTLRQDELVQYREQMARKRAVLERLAQHLFGQHSARRAAFETFLRAHPRVEDYARFRATCERRRTPWQQWPERLRHGHLPAGDDDDARRRYHVYGQWLAHEQMAGLTAHAAQQGVRLYLDMPLGVHRDGYDTWRFQDLFALDAAGGAPPDPVFTQGQDWGFAPLHPQRCREQGHRYLVEYLRHHLARAGMLRLDHVMGLHRLFWVPRGLPASQGAYVSYPAEEFYAILSLESHRYGATIAGENLGTVPPAVNRSLKRHRLAELYVAQYEFQPHPKRSLRPVPAGAVASLNTHDMPPFHAYWQGRDIADRHALGLVKPADLPREHRLRERVRRALLKLLHPRRRLSAGTPDAAGVLRAVLEHLSASAAQYVLLNLEDLWLETHSQNVPGTREERINWRRKTRFRLEQIRALPAVRELLERVNRLRQ